jgi:hypothetical protein
MRKVILTSAIASLMAFTSCQKEDTNEITEVINNETIATVAELIEKDATIDDVFESTDYEVDFFTGTESTVDELSEQFALKSGNRFRFGFRYRENACPEITVERADTESGFPKTVTVSYGDSTVLSNGRVMSGSIVVTISDPKGTDGRRREVEFVDYMVDSVSIAGGSVATYVGPTEDTNGTFSITRTVTCTFPDGSTVSRTSDKVREWIAGFDTRWNHADDIIHITGSSSSQGSKGKNYSKSIVEHLVKTGECREIVQGVVEITKDGELAATINYGEGECDGVGTVTKGDEVKEITLGRRCKIKK